MADPTSPARRRRNHGGRLRQMREARKLRTALAAGFSGKLAVQVGGGEANWVAPARYAALVRVGTEPSGVMLRGRAEALPLAEAVADLLLLIHVIEASPVPVAVLAEAARVLRGEGRLVVVTRRFPASPGEGLAWGAGRGRLGCKRLRSLIEAADLEWRGGAFAPCAGRRERAPACLGLGYASCAALAVKRVAGMQVLRPSWSERLKSRGGVLTEHGQTG